jgi:hypothetical protein
MGIVERPSAVKTSLLSLSLGEVLVDSIEDVKDFGFSNGVDVHCSCLTKGRSPLGVGSAW